MAPDSFNGKTLYNSDAYKAASFVRYLDTGDILALQLAQISRRRNLGAIAFRTRDRDM